MATDVQLGGFDVFKANAYSEGNVKFDLAPPRQPPQSPVTGATDVVPAPEDIIASINPDICPKTSPPKEWEVDVRGMISTKKWLQNYGLKKNRLDMHHLLPQIGFKHSDEYDPSVKRPICSRYGLKIFQRYFRSDGKTFNLACTKEQLKQIEARLSQAICLYKRRLQWLTTESRRIFGVVEEKSVSIVLDIRTMSPQQFDQYRSAVERLLKEQVSLMAKFNIIRASEDLVSYSPDCVPVSAETIEGAITWLWSLERCAAISSTATCEAIMKAMSDTKVEAIFMVTEGGACDGSRELLKEKLTGARIPVHIISYNCSEANTINFLKNLSRITGGRFHAYAVIMEMDSYEGAPVHPQTNQANILLKRKTYGGVPPGAGVREDVIALFEELEEARNNLAQVQGLIEEYPEQKPEGEPTELLALEDNYEARPFPALGVRCETYMSSREWIDKYGLKAKKLGFYDILAGVAFKHQDGVVDIKKKPSDEFYQTDAISTRKLVNARYCDKFPHVRWKDGQVVHVQVTPEIHRGYEQRMTLALEAVQQRIDWLQQGSREVFGTVIEDQIYFLIDTSASMAPHIQFVKDKLFVLMQEQLRHKQKFNVVSFDSRGCAWRDRLAEVNEKNLQSAWQWIKMLGCRGSTNTLAALRQALNDPNTQAIYLLTDGRPDQPPKSVLAQVHLHPNVPIHTISFNCADKEANEFLCSLAKDTGGRFHYYAENGVDFDGPEPWESEDIRLLKQEYEGGLLNLEKIASLRDECAALAWKKDTDFSGTNRKCSREHLLSARDRESGAPTLNSRELYRSDASLLERPHSAPGVRYNPAPPGGHTPRPATSHGFRPGTARSHHKARTVTYTPRSNTGARSLRSRSFMSRSYHGYGPIRPLTAGHTKTSLLRVLGGGGHFEDREWLLPETRELFDRQWDRQQKVIQTDDRKKKKVPTATLR